MSRFRSEFLRELDARGFIHQCTDAEALDAQAAEGQVVGYVGFDCTADSLHVGNLVSIMLLRWLQRTGGRPITLVGGGTTKVGDPSGKDESRQLLTDERIEANKDGIRRSLARFLDFGAGGADLVDNAAWLDRLLYIPFLGGSDQWGNIVNGVELGRRIDGVQLFGLTTPLITTASGEKMGKSAGNAVWLNADKLPAFDYWQFWRNTEDGDVGRFLRLYTELPLGEIARLERLEGAEINEAKKVLAFEATRLCHGAEAAEGAAAAAKA